uniref:Lipid desaturase domain-containing protein n=1 Tax=viral metagenome TaxID=1070528 RepID=A0A6C0LUR2_9ZZZZ
MGPLLYMSELNTFMMSLFLTISLNDVIHKYAHMTDHDRPKLATFMQKIYIFQSYNEHHLHHIYPHEMNYCPVSPYLNIMLEYVNFWRFFERIIEKYLGIYPRVKLDKYVEDVNYLAGIKFVE